MCIYVCVRDHLHHGEVLRRSVPWDVSRLSGITRLRGLGLERIIFFMSLVKDPFITVKFGQ